MVNFFTSARIIPTIGRQSKAACQFGNDISQKKIAAPDTAVCGLLARCGSGQWAAGRTRKIEQNSLSDGQIKMSMPPGK
jgi:hypothetical protein